MSFDTTLSRSRSSISVRRIAIAYGIAIVLATGCPVSFAWSTEARVGILELDPSKTLVEFEIGGLLRTTHGKFRLKSRTIKADSATGEAEGTIVVDATSGDSGDSLRDDRMKNSILETQTYPEIIFAPRHIDGYLDPQDGFQAKLGGLLKLHGVEHAVLIDARGTLTGDSLIATAHFSVPYIDWGLKDPSVLFLSVEKMVEIDIAAAGRITWLYRDKTPTQESRRWSNSKLGKQK